MWRDRNGQQLQINTNLKVSKPKTATFKSKNPRHPSENRVNYYRFFSQKIYAYRKSLLFFILLGGTVPTIVLPKQTHFLKLPYSI